jgi:hypothetical protein
MFSDGNYYAVHLQLVHCRPWQPQIATPVANVPPETTNEHD